MVGAGIDRVYVGRPGSEEPGAWVELPIEPAELDRIRPGIADAVVLDSSLEGPLGEVGINPRELSDPLEAAMLAEVIEANPCVDLDAVRAHMDQEGRSCGPCEYANAVLQADSIPFTRWWGSLDESMSGHERLARQLIGSLGGVDTLRQDELVDYFDFKAYGESLVSDGDAILGPGGYILGEPDIDLQRYDADDILGYVERMGLPEPEDPAEVLGGFGCTERALDSCGGAVAAACAAVVEDLAARDRAALDLYADYRMGTGMTPEDVANAALQAPELCYAALPGSCLGMGDTMEEWLGRDVVAGIGMAALSRGTLEEFFDFERWGAEAAQDYVLTDEGFLDRVGDGPDLDLYARDELLEDAFGAWDGPCGLDELEEACAAPASRPVAREPSRGLAR